VPTRNALKLPITDVTKLTYYKPLNWPIANIGVLTAFTYYLLFLSSLPILYSPPMPALTTYTSSYYILRHSWLAYGIREWEFTRGVFLIGISHL